MEIGTGLLFFSGNLHVHQLNPEVWWYTYRSTAWILGCEGNLVSQVPTSYSTRT